MELSIEIYPAKLDALEIMNRLRDFLCGMKGRKAIAEYTLSVKVDSTETYSILSQELEE